MLQASNNNTPDNSFHPLTPLSSSSTIQKQDTFHSGQETGRPRHQARATIVSKKEIDLSHDDIQLDVDDDYFQPDTEDKNIVTDEPQAVSEMCRKCRERENNNAYETYFKPKVFLQFLLMHFLYFFLLGPFIFILIPIFGKHILRNQGFLGVNRGTIVQMIQYFALVGFFFVFYYTDTPGLQAIEVYMILIAILIRFIAVCSKYAYRSESFIKLIFTKTLSPEDLRGDLLLLGWREQIDSIIEEEVQAAILRQEVDSSLFFFKFLSPPEPVLHEKLCKPYKKRTDKPENIKQPLPVSEEMSVPRSSRFKGYAKKLEDTEREILKVKGMTEVITPRDDEVPKEIIQIKESNKKELKKAKTMKLAKKETMTKKCI